MKATLSRIGLNELVGFACKRKGLAYDSLGCYDPNLFQE